jgi:hypothetical protein
MAIGMCFPFLAFLWFSRVVHALPAGATSSVQLDELGGKLSAGAVIYTPDQSEWIEATERWSMYQRPKAGFAVRVSSENDVVETVRGAFGNILT